MLKYKWKCKIDIKNTILFSNRLRKRNIQLEDYIFEHIDFPSSRILKYLEAKKIKTVYEFLTVPEMVWRNIPKLGIRTFKKISEMREELIDCIIQNNGLMTWLNDKEIRKYTS
jgi:hypothetical protein